MEIELAKGETVKVPRRLIGPAASTQVTLQNETGESVQVDVEEVIDAVHPQLKLRVKKVETIILEPVDPLKFYKSDY